VFFRVFKPISGIVILSDFFDAGRFNVRHITPPPVRYP
jgi:hypothetical protein